MSFRHLIRNVNENGWYIADIDSDLASARYIRPELTAPSLFTYLNGPGWRSGMNRPLSMLVALLFVAPAFGQEPRVTTRLGGMDLEVVELGVPAASADDKGVPAVKVTNRSNEIASCQFYALPEETVMTAAPATSINPNEEVVMRVPGKYSAGGPLALLVCEPEGA